MFFLVNPHKYIYSTVTDDNQTEVLILFQVGAAQGIRQLVTLNRLDDHGAQLYQHQLAT